MWAAGRPPHNWREPTRLPGVSMAPAASIPSLSITAPFITMAPRPTKARSSSTQPWIIAMWPISTSAPISVGKPSGRRGSGLSQWITVPSCTLLRAPITTRLTSPRITQLYQMLASGPIVTSPMIRQPGAMKALSAICGTLPPKGRIVTSG